MCIRDRFVERSHETRRLGSAIVRKESGGQINVDHLAEGVYAGVGSSRTDEVGWVGQSKRPRQRLAQEADDRDELGLKGETAETAAVVGEVEPPTKRGDEVAHHRLLVRAVATESLALGGSTEHA